MRPRQHTRHCDGFTLIEVLVVVAIIGVILTLAAPSFRELIEMRRLRGTHAQVMTDVQFARSEAVGRQQPVVMRVGTRTTEPAGTCYSIFTCNLPSPVALSSPICDCDCSRGTSNACTSDPQWTEIRTVEVANSSGVAVKPHISVPNPVDDLQIRFDPRTGGVSMFVNVAGSTAATSSWPGEVDTTLLRDGRTLRTAVNVTGRPSACSPSTPSTARVADTAVCP